MSFQRIFSNPFPVLWQTALVRLPRAVPPGILRYTSPEGPHPFILNVPSRGAYQIPLYVFLPAIPSSAHGGQSPIDLPVLLDFHGGGFYMGSCLEQAPFCARMARELGAVVISVDYRMGPLDKFPAATDDAEDVLKLLLDAAHPGAQELQTAIEARINETFLRTRPKPKPANSSASAAATGPLAIRLDRHRVAVCGFSSGGNIALNLGLSIPAYPPLVPTALPSPYPSDYPTPIPMLLFYPSLDLRKLPSERDRPEGLGPGSPFWTRLSDTLAPSYCPPLSTAHPRASPGLAPVSAALHPRAQMLLVLSGLDTLAEQSETWVRHVQADGRGAALQVERYPGMKHGWTQFPESWLDGAQKRAREEIFVKAERFLRELWELRRDPLEVRGQEGRSQGARTAAMKAATAASSASRAQ